MSVIFAILFSWFLCSTPAAQAQVVPESKGGGPHIEKFESLVKSATLGGSLQFYLPKKNQTHLLLYYVVLDFGKQPFQIFDINLDTGTTRLVDGLLGRPAGTLLHSNGLIYIGSGDPGFFMVYDPATGQTRKIEKLADKGPQNIIEGDDGAVYIGEAVKGMVERYNPKDGTWENYGIMDDSGPPYYRYVYTLGADDRYIYAGMGQSPWYLVIYDRLQKTQKVYWKNDHAGNLAILRGAEKGWYAHLITAQGPHRWYKLNGNQEPQLLLVNPPAVSPQAPRQTKTTHFPPKYEIDLDKALPDSGNGGKVTVRWRKGIAESWQQATTQLRMGPMDIKRLYASSDSTLFGFTSLYGPVFKYDPGKKNLTILGRTQRSLYDALFLNGEWYLVGYPATTMKYNPAHPWNLTASTKDLYDFRDNPRLLKVAPEGGAKYHYYLAAGADGYIYFGGHHERSGVGGSLGWYHPKTGMSGGLREPFLKHDVSDLIAVEGGVNLVFSGWAIEPGLDGKLFIFAADQKKLVGTMTPLPGERDPGKVIEVAPGVVLGVIPGKPKSRVYKADLRQGKVLWQKELEGTAFGGVRGFNRRLIKGPDGYVWLYIDNNICRLNPSDGKYERIIEAPPPGNLLWFKNDLYIYGWETLRRVSGLLKIHPQ